jgi:hypothetical protein
MSYQDLPFTYRRRYNEFPYTVCVNLGGIWFQDEPRTLDEALPHLRALVDSGHKVKLIDQWRKIVAVFVSNGGYVFTMTPEDVTALAVAQCRLRNPDAPELGAYAVRESAERIALALATAQAVGDVIAVTPTGDNDDAFAVERIA